MTKSRSLTRITQLLQAVALCSGVLVASGWGACQITIEPLEDGDDTIIVEPGDPADPDDPNDPTEPGDPNDPTEPGDPNDPTLPPECQPIEVCEDFVTDDGQILDECHVDYLCEEPPHPEECDVVEICDVFEDPQTGTAEEWCYEEFRCDDPGEPIDPNECEVLTWCENIDHPDGTNTDSDNANDVPGDTVCYEEWICPDPVDPDCEVVELCADIACSDEPNADGTVNDCDVFCTEELICPEPPPSDECFDLPADVCTQVEGCRLEELHAPCAGGEPQDPNTDPLPPQCDQPVELICVPDYNEPPQCYEVEVCLAIDENGDVTEVDADDLSNDSTDPNLVECFIELICDEPPPPPHCEEIEVCLVADENGEVREVSPEDAANGSVDGQLLECFVELLCEDGSGGGQTEPGYPGDEPPPSDDTNQP
jgi:hypothetical protein